MIVMEERHTNVILIFGVIFLSVLHETEATLVLRWNTTKPTEPFVMVRNNNGKWGEICTGMGTSEVFNDNAANVTCRQMGFLNGKVHTHEVQKKTSEIILDYVVCPTGEESSLSQCQYRPSNASSKCPFDMAIKVECTENPALNGLFDATLLREKKAHEGILEVTNGGTDGEVCYDAITADAVGKVVCKQMGYSGVDNTASVDSNSTSFYNASCPKGTEHTLAACTLTNSCSSKNVINVTCTLDKATQRHFDVRLSSPNNSTSEGTVEVYQYGRWGVVCDTDWDINDAEVVCRELGYKSAVSSPTAATFGQGYGVVFWNKMQCNGNESSIASCAKDVALGTKTCDSANAAGVVCNTERFATINICSNGSKVLEAGVTMIQSEAQPKPFTYSGGQACFLNLTSPTNFTVYIYKKMFEENHVEHLSFISAGRNETLYGDDSSQGPFDFSSRSLTIEFKADTASGSGVINIMVSVAAPPPPTSAAMTTETEGKIVGIVVGAVAALLIMIIILVFLVLWKKGIIKTSNRPRRSASEGSYEKKVGGQESCLDSKSDHNGGVDSNAFATYTSMSDAKAKGNDVIPGNGVGNQEYAMVNRPPLAPKYTVGDQEYAVVIKKKTGKDKKKSKENLAEDATPVGNDSCAVPIHDDFDMPPESEYAQVGARRGVGQINPAGQPEQNNSETYDHLDFKGRKTTPHNHGGEATYDTVHRL